MENENRWRSVAGGTARRARRASRVFGGACLRRPTRLEESASGLGLARWCSRWCQSLPTIRPSPSPLLPLLPPTTHTTRCLHSRVTVSRVAFLQNLVVAMSDHAGTPSARRRRERRLMELAAATHHSSPKGGWPDTTHEALRGQKTASSAGVHPGVLKEPEGIGRQPRSVTWLPRVLSLLCRCSLVVMELTAQRSPSSSDVPLRTGRERRRRRRRRRRG